MQRRSPVNYPISQGVSDPYEEPLNPEVSLSTDNESVEESRCKVLSKLRELGYLPAEEVSFQLAGLPTDN